MEDSFCVGDEEEEGIRQSGPSEEEEEEEDCVSIGLLPRDSFLAGPGQYLTRHRTRLNQARREHRRKPSRIRVISDSSEEETAVSREETMEGCSRAEQRSAECPEPPAQHSHRAGASPAPQPGEPPPEHHRELLPDLEPPACERLDLHPAHPIRSTSFPPAVPGSVQAPSEVCSLGTSDYIVSTRLAVERTFQSELQGPGNRNRLSQRLQRLQGLFQRVCVILETDRTRPGDEALRPHLKLDRSWILLPHKVQRIRE
ncbi:hypothetical protein BTVI_21130 [Pitangus sulphuratus]|nr:hypothetical protein BTVI_21130 [Pitangus sulphuratus]